MMYKVEMSSISERQLKKLTLDVQIEIVRALRALALNPRPHGYKKLVAQGKSYRIKVGEYRVVYSINDKIVTVLIFEICHRKDAYK